MRRFERLALQFVRGVFVCQADFYRICILIIVNRRRRHVCARYNRPLVLRVGHLANAEFTNFDCVYYTNDMRDSCELC